VTAGPQCAKMAGRPSGNRSWAMNGGPTIRELEERIAIVRQNLAELIEQAAAFSGAGDEALAADRIAKQEEELKKLVALRDAQRSK
jgi:hypothetical protein